MRLSRLRERLTAVIVTLRAAIVEQVGAGELLVLLGMALVTTALWPTLGRLSLLVPGVVALWIGLPSRTAFVIRPPAAVKPRRS